MRYLMLVLVVLVLAGCDSVREESYYTEPGGKWGMVTTVVYKNNRGGIDKRVGEFNTYAEARAECDRLNAERSGHE